MMSSKRLSVLLAVASSRRQWGRPAVAATTSNFRSVDHRTVRRGMSLLELLAIVTIIGTVAAIVVPRINFGAKESQSAGCHVNTHMIEVQTSLWRRENGSWPTSTLSNIGADAGYFPDGLPICPLDGSAYQIDPSTGRVVGHVH